ncbi:hypothetical protein H2248_004049 [Termitomyces sp. 'cryptogamus']|nr:hypothetical protein H2248_004049 [Termitomyces sp. 'cryptogamus']
MASKPPKSDDPSFLPTFMGYPPPPPQGVYPYLPFPAAQEASYSAGTGQPGYMRPVYYDRVPAPRPKRTQVKIACTNCANVSKRCDESRPCQRCIKLGLSETCFDVQRKERQKGIKRGPYKSKKKLPPASDAERPPGPAPPPGFYPMYYLPPGFIPDAPPLPPNLPYVLPPHGYPFPYPGLFHPPPPAPVPNEQHETNATVRVNHAE